MQGAVSGIGNNIAASLPTHYHAFGSNSGNNNGSFGATSSKFDYSMPALGGTRGWNGSGGGGSFEGLISTYSANMITSLAKTESGTVQPAALKVSVLIKHD